MTNMGKSDWIRKNINYVNFKKTIASCRVIGIRATCKKIQNKFRFSSTYNSVTKKQVLSLRELAEQRKTKFEYSPLISIITPTFNTPHQFLQEMIESVLAQTYANWELCIADGSNDEGITFNALEKFAANDARIKIRKLTENKGISENSNGALLLAAGDYIALLDHDDLLTPNALFEMVKAINATGAEFLYSDEDKTDATSKAYFDPSFKPDYSPEFLRSSNYICHFTVIKRSLFERAGFYFMGEYDGAQDYDLFLRCVEKTSEIYHIPIVLYHWRAHQNSTALAGGDAKPYTHDAGKKALQSHIDRLNLPGIVIDEPSGVFNSYKVNYDITGTPLISIIIPTFNHQPDLKKCINSILNKSTYKNFEILVVENNSTEQSAFDYYNEIDSIHNIKVLYYPGKFNYSAINNWAIRQAKGEYLVLMNNDIEIITHNWIEELLMFAQRPDVGAVGAKLLYPDGSVQHGGVILGLGGIAGHAHVGKSADDYGYKCRAVFTQNLSAVTAALMMIPRQVFEQVEGLDERYSVAFNDVDLCLKIRKENYLIVFNPFVLAFHYESKSRGPEDTVEKRARAEQEVAWFKSKWGEDIRDPYYNKNLSLSALGGFSLK